MKIKSCVSIINLLYLSSRLYKLAKRQASPSFRSFYCANLWKLWTDFIFYFFM